MTIVIDAKQFARDVFEEVKKLLREEADKNYLQILPQEIIGDLSAGRLFGKTANAMKKARERGTYAEGIHYEKNGKMISWNRDALLREMEFTNGSKTLSTS